MSFDQLLLNRPQYSPTHKNHPFTMHSHNPTPFSITTQISPIESPRFKDLVTVPKSLERGHLYDKLKASIKLHEEAKSIQTGIKNTKVREAYNLLSDFNDKKQIIQSLKQLNTADERIMLIDKILERKEEMQIANLRLKAKKLEPIFNVIRRKLKKQQKLNVSHGKLKKQSTILEKLHETTNNEVQNIIPSYRNLDEIQDETTRQEQVIEKIQNKYTTTIAFSWLTGRNEKQESATINLSPEAVKRHNRRNTTLQLSHKGITGLKQMVTKKVSENSEEMIRLGQLKLQESAIKNYNSKDIIAKSKPKVDTGRKKSASNCTMLRKKQTLAFVSNERKENSALNQKLANENSNIMFRRRLIDGK